MRMRRLSLSLLVLIPLLFSGCGGSPVQPETNTMQPEETVSAPAPSQEPMVNENTESILPSAAEEENEMTLLIGDTEVSVRWEENESVAALRKLVAAEPLTVSMSKYGGFEQVGSIGRSLPRNDSQTTTQAGDIVLYSGNQLVIFYGSNSWAYTRLGKITGLSAAELTDLLGSGNVEVTLSLGEKNTG